MRLLQRPVKIISESSVTWIEQFVDVMVGYVLGVPDEEPLI